MPRMQSAFITKVFSEVDVRILCRILKVFHFNLGTLWLYGTYLVHKSIAMMKHVCVYSFQ